MLFNSVVGINSLRFLLVCMMVAFVFAGRLALWYCCCLELCVGVFRVVVIICDCWWILLVCFSV